MKVSWTNTPVTMQIEELRQQDARRRAAKAAAEAARKAAAKARYAQRAARPFMTPIGAISSCQSALDKIKARLT